MKQLKIVSLTIIVLLIIFLSTSVYFNFKAAPEPPAPAAEILLSSPRPGQIVSSPLAVKGRAKGSWYFEAVFPVELVDGQGKVLGRSPARAQSDWQTSAFVPFIAEINYAATATSSAALVLQNDNPSGLPGLTKEIRIPIILSPTNDIKTNKNNNMKITSSAFNHQGLIPKKFTCDGYNINPPLKFSEVPDQAKSLALIMDDPDAPSGAWVHWALYNLAAKANTIVENSRIPDANSLTTSFGTAVYNGPCPPSGTHRYFFKLYALDEFLDASALKNADAKALEQAMKGHILATAELIGLYGKK